jgi:hypothetical protein
MGGNVTGIIKETNEQTKAQKIPLKEITRKLFIKKIIELFQKINNDFNKKYGIFIWNNESFLKNGLFFNGSTSFIMDLENFSDEEIIKYKPYCGDIDIAVPQELREKFWFYLDSIENKEILCDIIYKGSNKLTPSSCGDQINSVFCIKFKDKFINCQIDFEFLSFKNDKPTEWSKFSHNSSIDDAKENIKALHHKYLIRALVGGASIRNDIVIASPKSTPDKITLTSNQRHIIPRMLKFSVGRGIREAYEPLIKDNKIIEINNKLVYREIKSKTAKYITKISEIYKLIFKDEPNKLDLELFNSFIGILKLGIRYLDINQIQNTHIRYLELLWGIYPMKGQELEVNNPELDFIVKNTGYKKFIKEWQLEDKSSEFIDNYYQNYNTRKYEF